mmetsp:Transcript_97641/g.176396  ORF Transcript_97641/g.176396 Transcript_97641/m.176396 type:complete len:83 (-) Transcript_97641:347-595(-)
MKMMTVSLSRLQQQIIRGFTVSATRRVCRPVQGMARLVIGRRSAGCSEWTLVVVHLVLSLLSALLLTVLQMTCVEQWMGRWD